MREICFAEDLDRYCSALDVEACTGRDACPFYATHLQQVRSVKKAYAQIRSLPAQRQDAIAARYYKGAKPWLRTV